jgi:MFS transporter, ACS family, tartrate transporter
MLLMGRHRMTTEPRDAQFEGIAERTRRKTTRRLMPFLFVLYIIAYLDRVNIGYAALKMTRDLSFSNEVFGFGAGIFFVGYFLLEIPGTILVEVWSARKWIARIMLSWGLLASLTGLITNAQQFYWSRFFLGMAEAGFFPGIIVYLTHWYRREDRAKAIAMFMAAIPISQIIGAPLSGLLMRIDWWGYSGWRWLLILEGIPAVLFGVATLFYLTDWPKDARWLSDEEREWITGELEREKQEKKAIRSLSVWEAVCDRDVVRLTLAAFFALTSLYSFSIWLPKMVQKLSGLNGLQVTLVTGIVFLVALPAMLLNGRHSDQTGERKWHAALPLLAAAVLLSAVQVVDLSVTLAIVTLSMTAMALHSYLPAFWSLPTTFLSEAAAAACIGMINSFGNLGGFAGNWAMGFLSDRTGNYAAGMASLAVSALLAGLLILSVRGTHARKQVRE